MSSNIVLANKPGKELYDLWWECRNRVEKIEEIIRQLNEAKFE